MLNESCVPVLLKALDQICSLDLIDEAAEDCVLNATKVFQRLLKSTTERTSRVAPISRSLHGLALVVHGAALVGIPA